MRSSFRKPVWMTVLVVTVVAVAIFGSMLFSKAKTNVAAAQGCGMQNNMQPGHAMTDGSGCPMSSNGGMMDGCAMLSGKITSVDRDGTLTVRIKPADNTPDAVKTAIRELKAGDSISLMMTLGKAKSADATKQATKYGCPMHPEVTSDKPGQCPKCGMNLQPVNSKSNK